MFCHSFLPPRHLVNYLQNPLSYYIFGSFSSFSVEHLIKIIHISMQLLPHNPKGLSCCPSPELQELPRYIPLGHPSSEAKCLHREGFKMKPF